MSGELLLCAIFLFTLLIICLIVPFAVGLMFRYCDWAYGIMRKKND